MAKVMRASASKYAPRKTCTRSQSLSAYIHAPVAAVCYWCDSFFKLDRMILQLCLGVAPPATIEFPTGSMLRCNRRLQFDPLLVRQTTRQHPFIGFFSLLACACRHSSFSLSC